MRKIVTFIISILMIMTLMSSVQAKTTVDADLMVTNQELKAGDEIVVTLSLENYQDVGKGFNAYKATLEYDENIFEKVSESDFISLNDWEKLEYNAATKEFVAIKKAGSKEKENIVQVSLKVKEGAKAGTTSVKVVDLVTSEGIEDIYVESKQEDVASVQEVKVNITEEQTSKPTINDNSSNPVNNDKVNEENTGNNNTGNASNTANNSSVSDGGSNTNDSNTVVDRNDENSDKTPDQVEDKDDSGSKDDDNKVEDGEGEKTPDKDGDDEGSKKKTGSSIDLLTIAMFLIPLIIGLLILFIILFKRKKDDDENNKNGGIKTGMLIFFIAASVLAAQGVGVAYALSISKGDVNLDGKVDYSDVELLEYHLIHVSGKELVDDSFKNGDMNNDDKLTVTDLSLLVQKIEKKLDYDVVVSNVEVDDYYPNKNEEVTVKFDASAKYDGRVTSVVINGEEYEVQSVDGSTSKYQVKVAVGEVAGIKTFNITNVTLNTGYKQNVNGSVSIDVLKDKPSIANYEIKEDGTKLLATLSLDVVDGDKSLTNGTIQILNKENGKEVASTSAKAGKNRLEFTASKDVKYQVKIVLDYDLATNTLEQKQDCSGSEQFLYDYEFAFDYGLQISNIKAYHDQNETTSFDKNEKITLGFNATNNSESIPSKVTINDKEYDVILNGDHYEVQVDGFEDSGEKTLNITAITLSNNIKIDVSEQITIDVLKDKPSLSNYAKQYDINNSKVTLTFDISDADGAFESGKAILTNESDNTSQEYDIKVGSNSVEFNVVDHVAYSLKVEVEHARDAKKQDVVNEVLKSDDIKLTYEFEASEFNTYNSEGQSKYFEKNEEIKVGFNSTNASLIPAKAVINGSEYPLNKVDNQYQAVIEGFNESGAVDINLEKVILDSGKEISLNETTQIEILKDSVEFYDYEEEYNIESSHVITRFNISDNDNAFVSGKAVLTNESDNTTQEQEINAGQNAIMFAVDEGVNYSLKIDIQYARDIDKTKLVDETVKTAAIKLDHDYELSVSDLTVRNASGQTTNFEKNEDVEVVFNSTNNTSFVPVKAIINGQEYHLNKDGDQYHASIGSFVESGKVDINIEKIILSNGKELTSDASTQIEILKDALQFSGYGESFNVDASKVTITFNITDKDNVFVSGKAILRSMDDSSTQEKDISVGENSIQFDVKDDIDYSLVINATYARDTDKQNAVEETLKTADIKLEHDYGLTVDELKTFNSSEETQYFEKNEAVKIRFTSTNNTLFKPVKAVINGQECDLIYLNDYYMTGIDGLAESGKYNVIIEKIILDNGKQLPVNVSKPFEVLKDRIELSNYSETYSFDNSKVSLTFDITDNDNVLENGKAILTKVSDDSTQELDIVVGSNTLEFVIEEDVDYRLEIKASYARDIDKTQAVDETLHSANIKLVHDYELSVENVIACNSDGQGAPFDKNEDVIIEFTSTNNSSYIPISAVINGSEYPLTKKADNQYQANIGGIGESGLSDITIEKLILDNGKELASNATLQFEVLKDKVSIADYAETYDIHTSKVTLTFNIKDVDNAFVSGKAVLTKVSDNSTLEQPIVAGENTLEFNVAEDAAYRLTISADSARDINKQQVVSETIKTADVMLSHDYDFEVSDLNTYNNDGQTNYYNKNEDVIVRFNSTNNTSFAIEKAIINGNEYTLTKDGNQYEANIGSLNESGEVDIALQNVVLENGKQISCDLTSHIEVLKDELVLSDYVEEYNINTSSVALTFNITDSDNAFVSGKAILTKVSDNSTQEEVIGVGANSVQFNVAEDEAYRLDINTTYTRDINKTKVVDKTLKTADIMLVHDYDFEINEFKAYNADGQTNYFNKNEDVIIRFTSTNNTSFGLEKAVINGNEYTLVKNGDQYEANIGSYSESGKVTINLEHVVLENGKQLTSDLSTQIEVVKDVPVLSNYVEAYSFENSKVSLTFDLTDNDNAFVSGKALLTKVSDNTTLEEVINTGANTIEFNIVEDEAYRLEINMTYSSDIDKNKVNSDVIKTSDIRLVHDYELSVTNFKSYNATQATIHFNKNEDVLVGFNSSNNTSYVPVKAIINGSEYPLTIVDGRYQANIGSYANSGVVDINLEKVILDNGKQLSTDATNHIEVFKDDPVLSNYAERYDFENSKVILTFDITDNDNAFESGMAVLTNMSDNSTLEQPINAGSNTIEFTISEDVDYQLDISMTYTKDDNRHNVVNDSVKTADIRLEHDYEFSVTNLKSYNGEGEANFFNKNEEVKLGFNSSNNTSFVPAKAIINGNEYPLTKVGDLYQATLSGYSESGVVDLMLEEVILDNGKHLSTNASVAIEVLKDGVEITSYNERYDFENSKVILTFDITDNDNAFESGSAILTNMSDNSTLEHGIVSGANTVEFIIAEDVDYRLVINTTYAKDINKVNTVNETIKTADIRLEHDYELNVSNLQAYNSTKQTNYFNKNEDVIVGFNSTNNTSYDLTKAIINGNEYPLTKEGDLYKANIGSFNTSGVVDINLEKVILANNKQFTRDATTQIEVLKAVPTIDTYSYIDNKVSDQVDVTFTLHDDDNAITSRTITVSDANGIVVYTSDILANGVNTVSFNKTSSEVYNFVVKANYDLDSNALEQNQNEYSDQVLLNEEISVVFDNKIEMKKIQDITLYTQNGSDVTALSSVNMSDLSNNLDNYLVKVDMENLPSFYAPIRSYSSEGGMLKFVLDCEKMVQYNKAGDKVNYLEVEYGAIEDNTAVRFTLEGFINQIKANPSGTFTLNHDLDFTSINATTAMDITFTGTLNGNGHKIENISGPLFTALDGATIENLVIQNGSVRASGVIASTMNATTIRNVHLSNITFSALNNNGTGSFAGVVQANTLIENCSATNMSVGSAKRIGGFVGKLNNSTLRNCYLSGSVSANNDACGGLIGEGFGASTIENCYVNVQTNFSSGGGSRGGIIGNPENTLLNNNLSLATSSSGDGRGSRIFGKYQKNISASSTNNYELATSNMTSNASNSAVNTVDEATLRTKAFYSETLGWDETIWSFDNVETGGYPILRNADPNYNIEEGPSNANLYIPEFTRISKLEAYDATKEIAYHNMNKFIPFFDAKYVVEYGNTISSDHILNTKLVKAIVPLNSENEMIVSVTDKTIQDIAKIKVIFEDETIQEYSVSPEETLGNVVNYEVTDLGIAYNYPKYLLKEDSALITTLSDQIQAYTFAEHLNDVTSEDEDKRFKENFDQVVKANAREFVINLLANVPEYNISIDNQILENKVKQDLDTNNQLKKLLVAYNYFDRMYNINIGGAIVRDAIFFDGSMFNENLNPIYTTNQFIACTTRATNQSVNYYNTCLKSLTNKASIGDFLEFFIKNFAGYEDVTRWFPENYQGFVVEAPAKDFGTRAEYRAWNLMKRRQEIILATLTMPSDEMYMISLPSQLIVGSIRIYKTDTSNPAVREEFRGWLETYGELLGEYYNTTLKFVPDGENIITKKMIIHYDRRSTIDGGYQDPNTTEDSYVKNFYGMIKRQSQLNGSAAYANGTDVYWVANSVFFTTGIGNTGTFTHETAHNQDGYFYLLGNGRRPGAGGECFTDSVICQRMNIETPHFNALYNHDFTAEIAENLTQERINSTEKLEDFYKKMWEAVNTIDYIEAQAFLQCSPEVQGKVGDKYVWGSDDPQASSISRDLTVDEVRAMNLQTIQDLWDNKIVIRVGATLNGDSLDNAYWYLPHNDAGIPDAKSFKRNAFEMLSVGGYAGGFVPYMSGASQNDLEAIRTITKDETMTWERYQMNKYDTVRQKLDTSSYFNSNEMIQMFKEAMEADAQGNNVVNTRMLRRYLYCYLQRATNDFRSSIYDEKQIVHITSGSDFVEKIKQDPYALYVLDADIDLSGMSGTNSITDVNFVGELDGNGHTITGIGQPIFNMVKFSNVFDLRLDNISILGASGGEQSGVIARTISYSNLKNIHLVSGSVEGTNYVGGLSGKMINSFVKECSANIVIRATGNYVGGLVGHSDSSSFTYSYSLGQVTGRQRSGGLVGGAGNSYIGNCYSNVTLESTSANSSGGFVGETFNNTRVVNNVAYGSVKNAYKFDGMSAAAMFGTNYQNNYEYEEPIGASTLNRTGIDFTGKISSVASDTLRDSSFYTNTLHWNESIWDFTNVAQGGLPKLKNLDSNNVVSAIEKIDISTVEDFMRIQDKLDGIYNISADLDFSTITTSDIKSSSADGRSGNCIIPGVFTGKIYGNGHTLSNLTNSTLFNEFRGSVTNLNISDFNNSTRQDYVAAFARNTNGATLSNMKFTNITLVGANGVGVVTGMDGRSGNSTFKQISVENANVTGSGVYVAAFIGRKFGGSVSDCFIQGTVSFAGAAGGGVFGAFQGNERISNVVSKVNINRTKNTSGYNSNGGFIGEMSRNPALIENSITLGNIAHVDGSEASIGKFISYTNMIARLTNCFEYLDGTGVSYVTEATAGQLSAVADEVVHSVEFYRDTLQLDSNIWDFSQIETNGYPTLK